jgi:hypothetical protein
MERLNRFFFSGHLEEEEVMKRVVHKHWLTMLKSLFWPSATFIAILILAAYLPDKYVLYGALIGACATAVWWARNFMDYFLDAWVVTNKGVIDLAWHGWFHREASRTLYSDIQSVSYEIKGVPATLFRYGTITVEKISTGSTVSLDYVYKPKTVETTILLGLEAYMHKKNLKDATVVQGILAEFVAGTLQKQAAEKMKPAVPAAAMPKKKK